MRKRILLLLLLLFGGAQLHAQWVKTNGAYGSNTRIIAISGQNIFAGTESGIARSTNAGTNWSSVNNGLAYTGISSFAVSGTNIFAGTTGGGVYLSTNNGASWSAVNSGLTNKTIIALAIKGTNIFAGTDNGVHLSTNNGASWRDVNTGLANLDVRCFAVSGTNIFAGTSIGKVYISTNDGANWSAVNTGTDNYYIGAFAVSGSTIFAAASGGGAYRSTNNGSSWSAANSGLESSNVISLAIHGTNIFAGTFSGGVYLSTNNGASWTAVNSGLNNTTVMSLAISDTNIFAGAIGGIWRRPLSEMINSTITITNPLYGVNWRAGTQQTIGWTSNGIANLKLEYSTNNGSSWQVIASNISTTSGTTAGQGTYTWTIPNTPSVNCIIKISDMLNPALSSTSNIFSISAAVTLIAKVIFNVNMGVAASKGIFNLARDKVYLAGSMNGWNTTSTVMTRTASIKDTVFTVTVADMIVDSVYEYKFLAGTTWETDMGSSGANRKYKVQANATDNVLPAVFFNNDPLYPFNAPKNIKITFKCNMEVEIARGNFDPVTDNLSVRGDFNSWSASTMIKPAAGTIFSFDTTLAMSPGDSLFYKFAYVRQGVITWESDPNRKAIITLDEYNSGSKVELRYFNDDPSKIINILSPNGGEIWQKGTNHQITWTSSNVNNVKLDYTTDGGTTWLTILNSIPAPPGNYNWSVPDVTSQRCKIRITDVDDSRVTDMSDTEFSITPSAAASRLVVFQVNLAPIVNKGVFNPASHQVFLRGSFNNYDLSTEMVKAPNSNIYSKTLQLTSNTQYEYKFFITSFGSTSSLGWEETVGAGNSGNRILILADADVTLPVVYFNNEAPTVSVILSSPNGGENWIAASQHNITWTSTGITNVKLEYTTNNGSSWQTIVSSVPANTGTYRWTIPNTASYDCKVRISNADDPTKNDVSDAAFVISVSNPALIKITFPNGGDILKVGDQKNITWTSSNVDKVKIECVDNGITIHTITSTTSASDGNYAWIIKNTPSKTCRIRITDLSNNAVFDESDNVFEINYPVGFAISVSKSFTDATAVGSYRMVGLPGDVDIPLATTMEGTYPDKWKAGWDNGAVANYMVKYDGTDRFNFKPGKAFWILSMNPFRVSKNVNTVTLTEAGTFVVPLHESWNLISSPFEKDISWAQVQQLNGIPATDMLYDFNGSYYMTSYLTPYKGFYFFNRNNLAEIELPYVPPVSSVANPSIRKETAIREINIKAFIDRTERSSVKVKIDNSSSEGLDDNDAFYPPGDFEEVGLRLKNEGLSTAYKFLKEESRPDVSQGQEFNLILKNSSDKTINLVCSYSNIEEEICLLDEHGKMINLKEKGTILISPCKEGAYKLLAGSKEYMKEKQQESAPKEYVIMQNYPNPFNPLTTISYTVPEKSRVTITVFNLLGETISELVNEEKEAGYYQVTYKAAEQSSGIYFYRISAGKFSQTKKMILQK